MKPNLMHLQDELSADRTLQVAQDRDLSLRMEPAVNRGTTETAASRTTRNSRRRCKGYRADGRRCRGALKGRQELYCSAPCRTRAKTRRRKVYYHDYYRDNREAIMKQRENYRKKRREELIAEKEDLYEVMGFLK